MFISILILQEISYIDMWGVIIYQRNYSRGRGGHSNVRLDFTPSGKTSVSSEWSWSSSPPPSGQRSAWRLGFSRRPPGRSDRRLSWISARTRWSWARPLWSCRCRSHWLGWGQFHCGRRGRTCAERRSCTPADCRSCSCGGWGRWWRCSRNPRIRTWNTELNQN